MVLTTITEWLVNDRQRKKSGVALIASAQKLKRAHLKAENFLAQYPTQMSAVAADQSLAEWNESVATVAKFESTAYQVLPPSIST